MSKHLVDQPGRPDGHQPSGGIAAQEAAAVAATDLTAAELDTAVEVAPTRRLGLMGWVSVGWLALIVGAALLAPILPLPNPNRSFPEIARQGPIQPGHVLGGDANGRDMLSRVVFGARASLLIAAGAVLLGLVVGGFLGMLAGYFRGKVDTVLTVVFNVLLSFPALILVLALVAVFAFPTPEHTVSDTQRVMVLILALGLVSVAPLGRITRASTLSWSEREFVKAAQVIGARSRRIMFRELLPNVWPAMMSITFLSIAVVIVFEGTLALLGAGLQDTPSWGNIISGGQSQLSRAPHIVFIPSIAIFLTVLALNYLGDVFRARSDVRESVL